MGRSSFRRHCTHNTPICTSFHAVRMVGLGMHYNELVKRRAMFPAKLHCADGGRTTASVQIIPLGYWLVILVKN